MGLEIFLRGIKKEIDKFICGHSDYEEYRDEFGKINENTKTVLVSGLSALIGSQLGVSGTILSPIIVLSLYLAGKMGIKCLLFWDNNRIEVHSKYSIILMDRQLYHLQKTIS